MSKYRVWLLLILCNLFWAGNFVFGKYVVAEMSPLWITFSRWLAASFILLFISYFIEKPKWNTVIKEWPSLIIMGALGVIGYNMALYSALNYTSPTNAALINSLNPALLAILSVFLMHESFSLLKASGVVVSLLGVMLVLTKGDLSKILQTQYNTGDLLMLAAIIIWTAYSILGKRLKAVPPITVTAVSALFATLILAPFAITQGINVSTISPLAVTGIIYMIIFPSICSFIFWNISVREIGIGQAGIFLNLIPVFTAIISWILGDKITLPQMYGGLLVFTGVFLTTGMLEKKFSLQSIKNQSKNGVA